jgi:hypothetical protein
MSNKHFIYLQSVMPTLITTLEKSFPDRLNNVNYNLHDHGSKGLVGLNIHSDKYPSSLFWIDERLDVRPSFGSLESGNDQYLFNTQLKKLLTYMLKAI